ncbi:MAG: trp operon repressor [candidate division Zixibacteria bacterium]|nr:trp operon repressor [candidate division Zixibacteria bacterium]
MKTTGEIIRILCDINDYSEMKKLVGELFTPAELQDVALRWRLMKMLHQGTPQRRIADKLGVSLCKITRGSRVLKTRGSVTKRILDVRTGGQHAVKQQSPAHPR